MAAAVAILDALRKKPVAEKKKQFSVAFFVANALIAECIGGKIFSLEGLLGIPPANFTILGQSGLAFNLTCGVLLWPLEFVITDIVNEYYGPKAVRRISIIAVSLIAYAFVMFYLSMKLTPAAFWVGSKTSDGVPSMQSAFEAIFGQGMWIIVGSIVAFLLGQMLDVLIFHRIKLITGERMIWLRSTGSTLISQFIDSFVVIFIAFKIGQGWSFPKVFAIALVGYTYKFVVAILVTPLIYAVHGAIERYLGDDLAAEMKRTAIES